MDVKIEKNENTQKEIKVTVSVEEMKPYTEEAIKFFSSEMNIKGFRPGNAPKDVVENSVGKEKVWEEAARIAVEKSYYDIIKENNFFPISQPEINFLQLAPKNPVIYKVSFYVMPEVELPDYKKIAKKFIKKEDEINVSESEVDQTIKTIQNSRAEYTEVNRQATKGDQVIISFIGEIDGKKQIEEKDFKFSVGSGQFNALEGFEKEIIGMKPDENKKFKIKVSEKNKELAGKEISFDLTMIKVNEKKVPKLDDEFAKSLQPTISNLKELKQKIKEGIVSEKKAKKNEATKMELVESLVKQTDIEIPEMLVERELDNMKAQIESQVQQSGITFEDYLNQIGKKEVELKEEWKGKAQNNVAAAIILHKISEKEKITASEEEIEKEVDNHFAVSQKKKEDEPKESIERLRNYIHDIKKNQKIFDFLLEGK